MSWEKLWGIENNVISDWEKNDNLSKVRWNIIFNLTWEYEYCNWSIMSVLNDSSVCDIFDAKKATIMNDLLNWDVRYPIVLKDASLEKFTKDGLNSTLKEMLKVAGLEYIRIADDNWETINIE